MKIKELLLLLICFSFLSGCELLLANNEGVQYNQEYYGGAKVTESEYFKNGKKKSDWLFIHYMAADNSLDYPSKGSPLFFDLNEIEGGLFTIRNDEGLPKANCDSVNYVVLFDGAKGINTHPSTHIYDLGPDTDIAKIGSNTYDITDVSFIKKTGYEANTMDYRTLENFLRWTNKHYEAEHVVFVLGSHGGGPGGPSTFLESSRLSRIICPDETSEKNRYMSTREFAQAFKNAGYGSSNKLDLMVLDICLGAGFEDAYEIKDLAEYSVVSPNSTPGTGYDYSSMMELFNNRKGEMTAVDFGMGVCSNFFKSYFSHTSSVLNPTITMLDLSKVDACADAIDGLARRIKEDKTLYINYLRSAGISDYYYSGYYNILFDAGNFAVKVFNNTNTGYDVKKYIVDYVIPTLDDMILFSWRRSSTNSDIGLNNAYCSGSYTTESNPYGVTLCGVGVASGDHLSTDIRSWYKTDLAFGSREGGWADMIVDWFASDATE